MKFARVKTGRVGGRGGGGYRIRKAFGANWGVNSKGRGRHFFSYSTTAILSSNAPPLDQPPQSQVAEA